MRVKHNFFNYWPLASKASTVSYAKEIESNVVECSESNAPSNI